MLKILSGTILILLTLVSIVLGSGLRKGESVQADLSVLLPYSQNYIYSIYTDITKYPERKNNLDNIEVLELRGNVIVRWRENYNNGSWKEYEIIAKHPPIIFDYNLIASSTGHTAEITTTFSETNEFTEIIFTEDGIIPNTFRRGLRFLSGDDSFLRSQAKWLRVAILEEQLGRR